MGYIGRTPTGSILTSADIADGSIITAKLANDAVDNTKLDLADNYAFTGTVSGAGKVLQVVNTTINATSSGSAGSEAMIANYYAQITPSSTSSKVLVFFTGGAQTEDSNSAPKNVQFKLRVKNGSNPTTADTDLQQVRYGHYDYSSAGGYTEFMSILSFNALHSPATTGSVHFGISVGNYDGNPNWKLGISNYKSSFTLMEIEG
jgi:hypothetical protein